GGERARLALAMLLLHESHVLILDEPTNHLDMSAKDILKSALMKYNGALIVVSHDRDFLDGLVDNIYHFSQKKVKHYPLQIHEFLSKYSVDSIDELVQKSQNSIDQSSHPISKASREEKKLIEREERKRLKRIDEIETSISKIEQTILSIDNALSDEANYSQPTKIEELTVQRSSLQKDIDNLMEQWEQLQSS
ncbi:MAG: ABC transporter ATP-binding protein, partial [Candidatus Kapaibacteriota bacterium]